MLAQEGRIWSELQTGLHSLHICIDSKANNYFESALPLKPTLPMKLYLESETNNYLEPALVVKLNLDSSHFECNLLKHLKVYFGSEADSVNQLCHWSESTGDSNPIKDETNNELYNCESVLSQNRIHRWFESNQRWNKQGGRLAWHRVLCLNVILDENYHIDSSLWQYESARIALARTVDKFTHECAPNGTGNDRQAYARNEWNACTASLAPGPASADVREGKRSEVGTLGVLRCRGFALPWSGMERNAPRWHAQVGMRVSTESGDGGAEPRNRNASSRPRNRPERDRVCTRSTGFIQLLNQTKIRIGHLE